jgi:carbamoyltransferase
MMGLAPYGEPTLFDEKLIGGIIDRIDGQLIRDIWVSGIQKWSEGKRVGDPAQMTTPDNANIAASIQKLFEETMLVAIGQLELILERIGAATRKLSLSGGCMLNCPTNSRIWRESKFKDIHVEPACDDGGLPAGAALWVYHNLLDLPRAPSHPLEQGVPYLGLPLHAADIESAVAEFKDSITVKTEDNLPAACARRLAAGEVIGWFEGRSEIGPRALGHRSIVADPRQKETWARVNTIKGRELWRPLAPSVLEDHAGEWFKGLPPRSPFMMFVGEIMRDDVPAIAHVDGTARVQTVSKHCGGYHDLISRFYELTGCAVVLNTSMNGPGEPIAEYPRDAIQMLIAGRFDALAIGNMILERKR